MAIRVGFPQLDLSAPVAKRGGMKQTYTAVIRQDEGWWIGWIEEVPGVNSQGRTRAELRLNLRSALSEALEMNRADARAQAGSEFEEELLEV